MHLGDNSRADQVLSAEPWTTEPVVMGSSNGWGVWSREMLWGRGLMTPRPHVPTAMLQGGVTVQAPHQGLLRKLHTQPVGPQRGQPLPGLRSTEEPTGSSQPCWELSGNPWNCKRSLRALRIERGSQRGPWRHRHGLVDWRAWSSRTPPDSDHHQRPPAPPSPPGPH